MSNKEGPNVNHVEHIKDLLKGGPVSPEYVEAAFSRSDRNRKIIEQELQRINAQKRKLEKPADQRQLGLEGV